MPTFDARAAATKADDDYPPFPFTGMDGNEYHLPHPLMLTTGQADDINAAVKLGDDAAIMAVFGAFSPEAVEAIRQMPVYVSAQLFDAWRDSVGEVGDMGKLPGPPSATNRAARRSKKTSQPAGSG